jgi:hypothetical protein
MLDQEAPIDDEFRIFFDPPKGQKLEEREALEKKALSNSLEKITAALEGKLTSIAEEGGDTVKFLEMMQRLADAIDAAAVYSINVDPENLQVALNGVIALLNSREQGDEKDFAKKMVEALTKKHRLS